MCTLDSIIPLNSRLKIIKEILNSRLHLNESSSEDIYEKMVSEKIIHLINSQDYPKEVVYPKGKELKVLTMASISIYANEEKVGMISKLTPQDCPRRK